MTNLKYPYSSLPLTILPYLLPTLPFFLKQFFFLNFNSYAVYLLYKPALEFLLASELKPSI